MCNTRLLETINQYFIYSFVKYFDSMLLQGLSKKAIALYLNERDVPRPTAYRRMKGLPDLSAVVDESHTEAK